MNDMRKLINLMEGVMAVPGLNEKSSSEKQARFMAAAAHDPKFAKKVGMDQGVAKEFNKADTGTDLLSNAAKHRKTNEDSESDMQTADTQAVDSADSNFDAAQAGATEVDEAHVDTCRQSNPNPADEACAMNENYEYDLNFIAQAIRSNYDMATSEDELKRMVAGETGYGHHPEFDNMFHSALDHFLNGDDSMAGDFDDGMDGDFDSAMASAGHGSDEDYGGGDFPMEEDLNNGYRDVEVANGQDFFPNGADSPVVSATGPSGARQGDNPEQKKMQVAETHKELVYAYRNFLKESANQKKS